MLKSQNPKQPAGSNEVLKLYVSHGSEREYILIHGKKPLMILDLKLQLSRQFKIRKFETLLIIKLFLLFNLFINLSTRTAMYRI